MRYFLVPVIILILAACSQQTNKSDTNKAVVDSANFVSYLIDVHGMTCEGCENAISKGVESIDGIIEVSASHIDSSAFIVFDTTVANLDMIVAKIDEIGYEVKGAWIKL
jgi:Cu+-exporting ATPase